MFKINIIKRIRALIEKQKRNIVTALPFIYILEIGLFLWRMYPEERKGIEYWVAQSIMGALIIVTALYVRATFQLVDETRKNRPSGRLSLRFYQSDKPKLSASTVSFDSTYEALTDAFNSANISLMKKNIKFLVMEIGNIGDRTIPDFEMNINIDIPQLSNFHKEESYKYQKDLGAGDNVIIGIAKFYPAFDIRISIKECKYNDGYDESDFIHGETSYFHPGLQCQENKA